VNIVTAANLRRLIPASAVAAVLAFSWIAPLPSFASNGGSGYNCGVKGNGYHDHGKVCPNRPFPGQGEGLIKFGIDNAAPSVIAANTTATVSHKTTASGNASTATGNAGTSAKTHGRGNGQGSVHSHGRGKN
jgi:hypothetical protein